MIKNIKNILIVEDCPHILRPLTLILNKMGFNIIMAEDSKDAIGLLNKHSIDLLITDINMPNMNGIELTKEVCSMQDLNIPIIIMSSDELVLESESGNKFSNPIHFIRKPFTISEIKTVINNFLKS